MRYSLFPAVLSVLVVGATALPGPLLFLEPRAPAVCNPVTVIKTQTVVTKTVTTVTKTVTTVQKTVTTVTKTQTTVTKVKGCETTTSSAPDSGPTDTAIIQAILKVHNDERALTKTDTDSAPPLVWDTTLASQAQTWSDNCQYAHDSNRPGGGSVGESLGEISIDDGSLLDQLNFLLQIWAERRSEWDPAAVPPVGTQWTQMVWKSTTNVGCGISKCDSVGYYILVCRYTPRGNIPGMYSENVLPYTG